MQFNKYSDLITQLENEELAIVNLTPELYSQLFAAYLYEDRITDVKHLWRRLPTALKSENKEIVQLQLLSEALQKNKFAEFFIKAKYDWSDNIKHIIADLIIKIREDVLHLTGHAYTSIYEQNLLNMTQLTAQALKTACAELGWSYENDGQQNIVLPIPPKATKTHTNTDDQLLKLTESVSFLEN